MSLAPLLLLIGISIFVDEPAKPVPVPITGTVVPEVSDRPGVEARVIDRHGQPVVGADVWTTDEKGVPIRTTTDDRGRFRLGEIPTRRSFLFVEAAGYRFHGQVIEPDARLADVTLARSDEPRSTRRIDPARVPELFWRAASFRGSLKPQMGAPSPPDAVLALLLARYDRDAAMVLLQPILDRGPTAGEVGLAGVAEAVAAIDPARAVAIVESLPDDPDMALNPFKSPKNNARRKLAAFLAGPPADRWETITHRLVYLWIVGKEDIF